MKYSDQFYEVYSYLIEHPYINVGTGNGKWFVQVSDVRYYFEQYGRVDEHNLYLPFYVGHKPVVIQI